MIAIETHVIGPTNLKGSRYVASTCNGDRVIIPANTRINADKNHAKAAATLRNKLEWGRYGTLRGGHTKHGMAWIFPEGRLTI